MNYKSKINKSCKIRKQSDKRLYVVNEGINCNPKKHYK